MKSSVLGLLVIAALASIGCQRLHTETGGGGQAKVEPQYEEQYTNVDPNLPGDRDSRRVGE